MSQSASDYANSIDWLQPVNRDDPLTNGLLAWWMAVPGQAGWKSSQWLDLADPLYGNQGALTNMDPASDWQPTYRQGGFGQLDFDGSNDYVNIPGVTSLPIGESFTFTAWINAASPQVQSFPMIHSSDWVSSRTWQFRLESSGVLGFIRFNTGGGVAAALTGTTDLRGAGWTHVAATFSTSDGSRIFVDGRQEAFNSSTVPNQTAIADGAFLIGARNIAAPIRDFMTGPMDNIGIWSRRLSQAEINATIQDSKSGHPRMLRRVQTMNPIWFNLAGGGSVSPYYYYWHLLGGAA